MYIHIYFNLYTNSHADCIPTGTHIIFTPIPTAGSNWSSEMKHIFTRLLMISNFTTSKRFSSNGNCLKLQEFGVM